MPDRPNDDNADLTPARAENLSPSRRRALKALASAGVISLAGCLGGDDDDGNGDPANNTTQNGGENGGTNGGENGSENGVENGGEDPSTVPDAQLIDTETGEQVQLNLVYNMTNQNGEDLAVELQNNLALLGIDLQIEGLTTQELLSPTTGVFASSPLEDANPDEFEFGPVGRNAGPPSQTKMSGDWDILIGLGANSRPRIPSSTDVFFTRDGAANAFGYVPEGDTNLADLYEQATSTGDTQERKDIFNTIFATLVEDAPALFLTQSPDYIGFRDGLNTNSDDIFRYGAELSTVTRYRGDQTLADNPYTVINESPLTQLYPPGVDDTSSAARLGLQLDGMYTIVPTDDDRPGEIFPYWADINAVDPNNPDVYTVTLRDNLAWGTSANGTDYGDYTAEDLAFHLNTVEGVDDPDASYWEESTPPSNSFSSFQGRIDNIEQTGDLEIQVELPDIDPSFPFRPLFWGYDAVLPKQLIEQYQGDAEGLRQAPEFQQLTYTGNLGPYSFESRTAGQTGNWRATRNDDYYLQEHVVSSNVQTVSEAWANAPYFPGYQFDNEGEEATAVERFRAGDGDEYTLSTEFVGEFRQSVSDVFVEESRTPFISFGGFNLRSNGNPLIRDHPEGRQSIAQVVRKQRIANQVLNGFATPAVTFQPTWSTFYSEEGLPEWDGINVTASDVEAARERVASLDRYTVEEQ